MTRLHAHHLLRRHRQARGWSISQVADLAGPDVTARIVELVEAGHPYPNSNVIEQILNAVGLDASTVYSAVLADLSTLTEPVALGWIPTTLDVALVNIENGGENYPIEDVLDSLFEDVPYPPGLIVVTEAKGWGKPHGGERGLDAAAHLSDVYGPAYEVRIGHLDRADLPPAILWDPSVLRLRRWDTPESTPNIDCWNRAVFTDMRGHPLTVMAQHWHPWSGEDRLRQAHCVSGLLDPSKQVILAGDFNSRPSGPNVWPEKNWEAVAPHRRHHKGWQPDGPAGRWVSRTDALDHLIGAWHHEAGTRLPGAGWHTAVEVDWVGRDSPDGEVFTPTTHSSGGMVIDHILLSDAMRHMVVPGSYKVHVPTGLPVTDHRLVTVTLTGLGEPHS